ncbi:SusC/RagA family TonB-linked outer membrane protein [Robertkochia marina]|uniref:SusC/RagA family TonB-linked outer membrane protein n=1 Tax=Robertkochia marina TaxID=1227945 RepID=A0A4S3LXR1_9FLAO|nr:SusC/RagA family TonB-linked outer membrane protein [Robertkochia marina]THD65701.1 SusC/RagA family TonB-linked outer membrane protein [Robertkochia marina]TRZ46615.1 SusC/RagA family TonB-linked outer membrane protein [Robertkochia marina]
MNNKRLLKNSKTTKALMFLGLLLLPLAMIAQANIVSISGTVTDTNSGTPLAGVTVMVSGTTFGTTTNFDGNYELNVGLDSGSYVLEAAYLGFATSKATIEVGSQSSFTVNFQLTEDLLNLDEIVVTGTAGNVSRRSLGNAVGSIKAAEIANTGSNNPLSAISGKVAGAIVTQNSGDPAGGFSVRLRGISTINGSSEPLYVIDGVIVDNSSQNVINLNADAMGTSFQAGQNRLVDINPNDIESIEVLNGAAAAAIYGSLASNGVVQIITKKGKAGDARVNFSTAGNTSWVRKRLDFNDFPERFGYPGSERLNTTGDRLTTIADLRSADDRAALPGTGPAALAGRPLVEETYAVTRYDYQDLIFRDIAYGTENNFSIAGGSEKSKLYFSTNYNRNQGVIEDTYFQKYGARLTYTQELSSKLSMTAGLTYNNSSSEDKPNGNNFFSPISSLFITDNVWDADERDELGNLLPVEPVRLNPLTIIETYDITQETNRFIGNVTFNYTPIENLNIKYTAGQDSYSLKGNVFQPRVPYSGVSASFFPDGYASVATNNFLSRTSDLVADYKLKLTEDFTLTSTVGGQYLYRRSESTRAEGRDLQGGVQTINGVLNLFNPPSESRSEFALWGGFLQENLNWDNKIYLTLSGRIDGASSFSPDNRNQFYPKASTSIILSDFDFWNKDSFWNTLKLRSSYGEAGNLTAIGPFSRFNFANPVLLGGLGGFVATSSLGDENIRPERMKEFEVGADMSFWNGRLALQGTYYTQNIEDLVLTVGTAPTSGGTSLLTNVGTMKNNGIELQLNVTPIRSDNFIWNSSLAYNTYNNEVNDANTGRLGQAIRGGGGTQSLIDGQPLGVFVGTFFARNEDGSLLLSPDGLPQVERGDDTTGEIQRDANGQPDGTPLRKILGDPNPEYTASFINEFSYKRWNFRMQLDAIGGFDVYNWNSITGNNVGNGQLAEAELRGEVPRGWVAAIGGFIGPRIQEFHVEDGSFVKLRELQVSYDFGQTSFAENLQVSLIGRNLVSFDDYTGFDPETNSAGQSNRVRGDDFGNVPIPATLQLRLSASF